MPTPQPGIFALGTRSHLHLEFDVHPSAGADELAPALAALREPAVTAGGANLVVGFADELWRSLAPAASVPADLRPFVEVVGPDGTAAPATQHDLWVWVHGTGEDVTFDAARAVVAALAPAAQLAEESRGFVFHDSRDLTGFVDGTANPPVDEAVQVAVVPEGLAGAGGSHVLLQRWIHDLAAFDQLPLEAQEAVIGRAKADSAALPPERRSPSAHIVRAEVHDAAGDELPVWRRSVPFGTTAEHGLIFVAFSADRARVDAMLHRMFGLADDGVRDALLDYTRAVTGAFYYCPPVESLPADPPAGD